MLSTMLPFSSISGESSLSNQDSLIYLFMCCGLIGFAFCVSFFVSNFLSFFVSKLFLSSFVAFSLSSFLICISSFEVTDLLSFWISFSLLSTEFSFSFFANNEKKSSSSKTDFCFEKSSFILCSCIFSWFWLSSISVFSLKKSLVTLKAFFTLSFNEAVILTLFLLKNLSIFNVALIRLSNLNILNS